MLKVSFMEFYKHLRQLENYKKQKGETNGPAIEF
jgi:hypothetical protein